MATPWWISYPSTRSPRASPTGRARVFRPEPHPYGSSPKPVDDSGLRLDLVLDALAQGLETAADAEHRAALGGAPREGVSEAPLPQPRQRLDRPPGAGHDDEVGVDELLGPVHEPDDHARFGGERVDVREVGHQRDGADGDPQHVRAERRRDDRLADGAPQGDPQAVLLVDAEPVRVRQDTEVRVR
ncbi:hypothetical protein STANM309S_04966 [Streptomyces tanashiensis]